MHPDDKFQVYSSMLKQRQQESEVQEVLRRSRPDKGWWVGRLLSLIGNKLVAMGRAAADRRAHDHVRDDQTLYDHVKTV